MTAEDNDVPLVNEFRRRGEQTTRLDTFVDAAFAFSLTLLVISFDNIPSDYSELVLAMKGIPSFAASFAIVCMFWVAHRGWSSRYGLDDTASTLISFGFVFVVLIYVFPLRVLMAAAVSAVTGGWAPSNFELESYGQARGLLIFYGLGFAAANLCIVFLNLHALRVADRLKLNDLERFVTRAEALAWGIVAATGVLSCILALLLPDTYIWIASWMYASLAVVMPVFGWVSHKWSLRYETAVR